MKLADFLDCKEEIFIWSALQFPLYFIVGWWVIPIGLICGILGRIGGTKGGVKWARWAIVPLLVCLSAYLTTWHWQIFLAAPFMVKLMPFSYGKSGWLYKWLKNDFLVRLITYFWFWFVFAVAYSLSV